jgi:hypothetical protein
MTTTICPRRIALTKLVVPTPPLPAAGSGWFLFVASCSVFWVVFALCHANASFVTSTAGLPLVLNPTTRLEPGFYVSIDLAYEEPELPRELLFPADSQLRDIEVASHPSTFEFLEPACPPRDIHQLITVDSTRPPAYYHVQLTASRAAPLENVACALDQVAVAADELGFSEVRLLYAQDPAPIESVAGLKELGSPGLRPARRVGGIVR